MQQSTFLHSFGRLLESPKVSRFLSYVLIPLLILAILLLPPIQLWDRIQNIGHTKITPTSGELRDPDGTIVIFPADGLSGADTYAKLSSTPRADFERGDTDEELRRAAEVLPANLRPRSPVYQLSIRGAEPTHAIMHIPIPNDSLPYETLDVYHWSGEKWEWMPRAIIYEEDALESDVSYAPHAFMVMQTNPTLPNAGSILPPGASLPQEAVAGTTVLFPSYLMLRGDGGVDGAELLPSAENTPYATFMTVRNYESEGAVPRTDLLANLLIDGAMQEIQINTLAELAASKLYDGVALDYRGVDPPLRADYVRFVNNLAARLQQDGKKLAVFVDPPLHVAEDRWETFGYDWQALGETADMIVIPGSQNPLDYAPGGSMESLLAWAVGQVNRTKLQLKLPARTVEQADNYFIYRGYGEALAPIMGEVALSTDVVQPGDTVQAGLQSDIVASPLQFDPTTGISWYRYRGQSGEERIVFLEDASSLANKVSLANRFNLGGVVVESLLSDDIDARTWEVMASYARGETPALSEQQLSVNWMVVDEQGNVVASQQAGLNEVVALSIPDQPGAYRVEAQVVDSGEVVSQQDPAPVAVATFTPTPTPTPEFTPTPTVTPTPEATPTPTPLPYAVAIATGTTNLRAGPGTVYNRVGQLKAGEQLKIIGKNKEGTWWQLEGKDGKPVWIIANRVTTQGPVNEVTVAKNIPKPPKRQPASTGGGGSRPIPAGAGSFGYGIQIQPYGGADIVAAANYIKSMGFNWVKWQVPWKDMEGSPGQIGWGGQDNLVNFFAGQGLNILASIVKAPKWARPPNTDLSVEGPPADPQTFANFLGAYAGRYCGKVKAIEVWNEQNLHYEWGNEPLDPARYMELLKRSYQAIKAACPQMIVVSGALTPAGNVGALAIDDFQYLEAMYRNGLKNWSDAIGAHPSGFNVPPNLTWQQACDFITRDNASFRGPCDNPHHSWAARSTMEGYRNIMVRYGDTNKRIWPTEFGWAAGGALDPRYGYANDNTYEEQARWTVEFFQWMKSTGYVGPAFLWNLNFGLTNPGTELAQWSVLGTGSQLLQALTSMPK
ncbi:MAG: SH3 domain-containing protein [Chloroflexi bacterium]|nr:SH3 domain-containing protein [Chloroflexota bacterium]